jgi:protein ImuA
MFLFCSRIVTLEHTMNIHRPLPPTAELAAARNRATVMEELRRLLPGVADARKSLPFGLAALDSCLPGGGLACGALHEVVPQPRATAAAFGFMTAILARLCSPLPSGRRVFLVMPSYGFREYGRPHGHGFRALGLDPARLILVTTGHRNQTLWAIEEALRSGVPAAIAGTIDRLDLKLSQRLHLAATDAGLPILLLRPATASPAGGGEWAEASAAATRWRVGTAAAARDRFGLITHPRWHLHLERVRNGRPGEWTVEYNHVAHRFSLAAALADSAVSRGTGEEAFRHAC